MIEIIYISGCIFSYLLGKRQFKKQLNKWTTTDRGFFLSMSLLSWLSVLALLFITLMEIIPDSSNSSKGNTDKPAKW